MPELDFICQVHNVNTDRLVCPHHESGGYQCERLVPHPDDKHYFGKHTIEHARWGNGYSCTAFYVVPDMLPMPDLSTEQLDEAIGLSKEIHNKRYPRLIDPWNPSAGHHHYSCWDGECFWDAAWIIYTKAEVHHG